MKSNFVSLRPYFKVHPGKVETVKAFVPQFIEKTATEKDCLFYGFTSNGEEMFAGKHTKTRKHWSRT
jgi:quinol monooxygenase YgiN